MKKCIDSKEEICYAIKFAGQGGIEYLEKYNWQSNTVIQSLKSSGPPKSTFLLFKVSIFYVTTTYSLSKAKKKFLLSNPRLKKK